MFALFGSRAKVATLSPPEVQEKLKAKAITLVDVREPSEYQAERIKGALNVPLSQFDAKAGTIPLDKPVVLHCLSGARSARAIGLCAKLGLPVDTHMAGGISAWKMHGLPVER